MGAPGENPEIAVENTDFSTISTGFSTERQFCGNSTISRKEVNITTCDNFRLFTRFFAEKIMPTGEKWGQKKVLTEIVDRCGNFFEKRY